MTMYAVQNAQAGIRMPAILPKNNDDIFLQYYNAASGVPAINFHDSTISAIDGVTLNLRIATPIVIIGKAPVIVFIPDLGAQANSYDLLVGALVNNGFAVIVVAPPNVRTPRTDNNTILRRNAARAQYIRFVLDKKADILGFLGEDIRKIDQNKIGVLGHGDGALTALELIGWSRSLNFSLDYADARINAAIALAPRFETGVRNTASNARRVIYGRGMVIADYQSVEDMPRNTGLMGLGLPISGADFGNLLYSPNNPRRRRSERPARECLASSIAAASIFYDWLLKDKRERVEDLNHLNSRAIPNLNESMLFGRY